MKSNWHQIASTLNLLKRRKQTQTYTDPHTHTHTHPNCIAYSHKFTHNTRQTFSLRSAYLFSLDCICVVENFLGLQMNK